MITIVCAMAGVYLPVFGLLVLAAWLGEEPHPLPVPTGRFTTLARNPTAPSRRGGACHACRLGAHRRCPSRHHAGAEGDCTCYDDAWEWHERIAGP